MKWEEDLLKDIRLDDEKLNDQDYPFIGRPHGHPEFSPCNREALLNSFSEIRDNCKAILEIGVHRSGQKSSTQALLDSKLNSTQYVGIDILDKSYLNNKELNIHTIRTDSSNYYQVVGFLSSLGIDQIDYFFIDGWHSINQVLKDWEYTKLLSPNGIVGFHDTTRHPGPKAFIEALDPDKWETSVECLLDNGIGFAKRK